MKQKRCKRPRSRGCGSIGGLRAAVNCESSGWFTHHVRGADLPVDGLTKQVTVTTFERFLHQVGIDRKDQPESGPCVRAMRETSQQRDQDDWEVCGVERFSWCLRRCRETSQQRDQDDWEVCGVERFSWCLRRCSSITINDVTNPSITIFSYEPTPPEDIRFFAPGYKRFDCYFIYQTFGVQQVYFLIMIEEYCIFLFTCIF